MPQATNSSVNPIYFVAYGVNNAVHYGCIEPGTSLTTGQPNVEQFQTKDAMAKRAFELGEIVVE